MYDYCKFDVDFSNLRHHACTEVRPFSLLQAILLDCRLATHADAHPPLLPSPDPGSQSLGGLHLVERGHAWPMEDEGRPVGSSSPSPSSSVTFASPPARPSPFRPDTAGPSSSSNASAEEPS